jgi:hypothetical protein
MQFESGKDGVKKSKVETVEEFPRVVVDPVPLMANKPARSGLPWKALAIAVCVLVVFVLGFLASSVLRVERGVPPAVVVQPSSTTSHPGGISRRVSAPPYTILKSEGDHVKDIFFVRLREKATKSVLAELADEIRRKESTGKERTVIWLYLPQVDAFKTGPFGPPWALADFNPGLTLEVYGLNAEQEAELAAIPIPPGPDVVGRWIEDCNGGEGLYTIYRKSGVLYLQTVRSRTSEGIIREMVEAGYPTGRRFERNEASRAGDHYLVNSNGDLEVRDNQGLISVCKKVD